VGREGIFKPIIRNDSLHDISNDDGVRAIYFATSESLIDRIITFSHRNIHKLTQSDRPYFDRKETAFKYT
jgi:hypothetical protein